MDESKININGFGKIKDKVHIIVDDIYTVCTVNLQKESEKRTAEINKDLTIQDVNCAKCMRSKLYKNTINANKIDDQQKAEGQIDQQIDPPIEQPAEIDKEEKAITETNISEQHNTNNDQNDSEKESNCQRPGDTVFKEKIQNRLYFSNGIEKIFGNDQFIARLRTTDFKYRIIHRQSGKIFFDKIDEKLILQALLFLNMMQCSWDGSCDIPVRFISQSRLSLKIAYEMAGKKYPEEFQKSDVEIDKKIKIKLKRRSKIPQLKLKRRNKIKLKRRSKIPQLKLKRRSKNKGGQP